MVPEAAVIVFMEVGEDGGGVMRRADPDEDLLSWARLMVNREPDAYWGYGQGDRLRRIDPTSDEGDVFSDIPAVRVLDLVVCDDPAVWVKAEVPDSTTEVGIGFGPSVTFEDGLP